MGAVTFVLEQAGGGSTFQASMLDSVATRIQHDKPIELYCRQKTTLSG